MLQAGSPTEPVEYQLNATAIGSLFRLPATLSLPETARLQLLRAVAAQTIPAIL
jgi:hypothetical protein